MREGTEVGRGKGSGRGRGKRERERGERESRECKARYRMQHESKQGSGAKEPLRKGFVVKLKNLGRQAQFLVDYVWVHLFPVDKLRGRRRKNKARRTRAQEQGQNSEGGS